MDQHINNDHLLGRAVFSKRRAVKAQSGSIRHDIFLEKLNKSLSVDRWGECSKQTLTDIQDKNADLRSKLCQKKLFYGWALIKVADAKRNKRTVRSSPIKSNLYHAEIFLPKNIDRDQQIAHAKELAVASKWEKRFKKS